MGGNISVTNGDQTFNGQYTGYYEEDPYSTNEGAAYDGADPPSYSEYEVEEIE